MDGLIISGKGSDNAEPVLKRPGCWSPQSCWFCFSPDAPGATLDAGWEGNIRAMKWRTEEGSIHDECKGKQKQATLQFSKRYVGESYDHLFFALFFWGGAVLRFELRASHLLEL
jgi:hypothetical protein